ncbi:MAG: hypothetical protein NTX72_03045 [Candidatus Uhrbacteria bacterium]|nr:hypothetical protein [Candidatus Uhrbacteria bacterium]
MEFNEIQVVPLTTQGQWSQLRTACPMLTSWGLKFLQQGLADHVRTAVVERRYVCKDHRNLHSNFYSKKFQMRQEPCSRIHFFTEKLSDEFDVYAPTEEFSAGYVGYSVIRPVTERCIGRTVLDPWLIGRGPSSGHFMLRTGFRSHINGTRFNVSGFPMMSQDSEATVCAHSALWSVCRYLSERYPEYPEIYPYDLIDMTQDVSQGRRVPYRGMTYRDYATILSQFGCHPVVVKTRASTLDTTLIEEKYQDLCTYVESGFPILASHPRHVVVAIGHTLDKSATPKPDGEGLVSSSEFLKQFVVVDDNAFPYRLLGRAADPMNYSKKYSIETIHSAVCPLPELVFLPAEGARRAAKSILRQLRTEFGAALLDGEDEPLVTRLFLTNASALQRRRREKAGIGPTFDEAVLITTRIQLPHFVWVMEVGPMSLYKQGYCTAEIVLDSTANEREECLIYARVGSNLVWSTDGESLSKPIVNGHSRIHQYTHNLGEH